MTQKTRGHSALNVCMAFVVVAGVLYLAGGLLTFAVALGDINTLAANMTIAGLQIMLALFSFTVAGLIRLAVHVADDLYMLRLIAVNAYSRLPQLPKP